MDVLTDDEAQDFVTRNAWASGLHLDERDGIGYRGDAASCIRLSYPETPLRVTYAARLLSLLGSSGDEAGFNGALLWVKLWGIGSPQLEMSGWKMMERMRMGYTALNDKQNAIANWQTVIQNVPDAFRGRLPRFQEALKKLQRSE